MTTSGELVIGGPCAAGIVFALPIEADAFERLATDRTELRGGGPVVHEGTIAGMRVAWCIGGVGRERAARAATLLLDGHRPQAFVSAGFAGGLDPTLARGSVVRLSAVCGHDGNGLVPLAGEGGRMLITVDRIVRTPAEKQSLADATGAAVVDMETLAVAELAREARLPCHAVRVISDAAGDELPADLGRLLEPQSAARKAGAVLGMLGRRPRAALDLWSLWERAVVDGRALAVALEQLCGELSLSHRSPSGQGDPSAGRA